MSLVPAYPGCPGKKAVKWVSVGAFSGPAVWNPLHDSLLNSAIRPDQFQCDLRMHLFAWG